MVRKVEFLGGPWDGARVMVADDQETAAITDGHTVHLYERGELIDGHKVRQVFRHVRTVPIRKRGEK